MSFTAWRMKHQKFETVLSLYEPASVRNDLVDFLTKNPPKHNECYQNAQKICAQFSHVNYVLGRITVPEFGTMDHAWNSDEYGHFDVTLFQRKDFPKIIFQSFYTLSSAEVVKLTWMGMPPNIFEVFTALQSGSGIAA